ncbi:zinc ABC transporter substrate-binding protein [Pseudomonas lalucatii]|uniref:Zinc ABC transporter substrate-binding protein n=1 Tax=Pseudomonas lalucatii TaxID=1424203 RepID=A0ABS5Q2W5_9PSED|nr:zinc ABC transporter substrate-binding protein [Pseudomonas lalucatii]MBS7662628.1 zinc ABC transporter substrate-binding protein [Pseudomonas lalucatii]
MIRTLLLIALGLLGPWLAPAWADSGARLKVVTSYSILYDIVKNVGGERVEIHSLAPLGSNPHEYDPLPLDVQQTSDADLVFYNGLNLEAGNAWFDKLLRTAGKTGADAPVFRLSEGVTPQYLTSSGQAGSEDPHAWLDARNGMQYARNARDALIRVDPGHAATYQANAAAYIERLQQLHDKALAAFAEIPVARRYLVTSEGAFKYFCAAYGFDAGYIWEINAENQGTPQQVIALLGQLEQRRVPALFVETSVDARSMQMVSRESGIPIAGTLYTDSLGLPGTPGDSYAGMLEANIRTILAALR